MAKIGFRIKSKINKPVTIYIYFNSSGNPTIETKTPYHVLPKSWSKNKQQVLSKDGESKNLNATISSLRTFIISSYNKSFDNNDIINSTWLKERIKIFTNDNFSENKSLLVNHIEKYVKTSKGRLNPIKLSKSTNQKWNRFRDNLTEYEATINKKLLFENINKAFIDNFTLWLTNEKKYAKNTLGKILSQLKTLCSHAEKYNIKVNPFYVHISSIKESKKERYIITLTKSEIDKIKNLRITNPRLENVRKWTLLGINLGQRGADLLRVTKNNIRKTKNGNYCVDIIQGKGLKEITAPIHDKYTIDLILDAFPNRISVQKLNKYLKELCLLANISEQTKGYIKNRFNRKELVTTHKYQLISSHCFRRTFATLYHGKVPINTLMSITGHTKESTFLLYIGKAPSKDTHIDIFNDSIKQDGIS